MNAHATLANPRPPREKLSLHRPRGDAAEPPAAAAPRIVPSAMEMVPVRELRRAPENVRRHRPDEDLHQLADDIAAHGLLQSLIGYRRDDDLVHVVGGGRRLQALRHLDDDGRLDGGRFTVPVLIRSRDEAIELSLAENIQRRDMSPVDEYQAFKALVDLGTWSPAQIAARFGFSERQVRQRLRLAQLEPEVLDALARRELTIDAAMAYASSQDRELQREVFAAEQRRFGSYRATHRPDAIRHAIKVRGQTTDDPVFRFVGAAAYEARGGGYEDDLFLEGAEPTKQVAHPHLLIEAAREQIDTRARALLDELRAAKGWSPSISGYVVAGDLRVRDIGAKPPAGWARIDRYDLAPVWRAIRRADVEVRVQVGIDQAGELVATRRLVFVPIARKAEVDGSADAQSAIRRGAAEIRAQADRAAEIARIARRLAVGPFTGTPFEGRAFWPGGSDDRTQPARIDGVAGQLVSVFIFTSDDAIVAQRAAAEAEYDRELAERASDEVAA